MDIIWWVAILGILMMIGTVVGITWGMMNLQDGYDVCLDIIESGNSTELWNDNDCSWYKNNVRNAFR